MSTPIDNRWDIGAVLRDLTSLDFVRQLASSILTAGLGHAIGDLLPTIGSEFLFDAVNFARQRSVWAVLNTAIRSTVGAIAADGGCIGGGLCVSAAIGLLAAASYATWQGDGDPLVGPGVMGRGEDPLSRAISAAVVGAVEFSSEKWPEATLATLNLLQEFGDNIEATASFIDDASSGVFSSAWNDLDPETQDRLPVWPPPAGSPSPSPCRQPASPISATS